MNDAAPGRSDDGPARRVEVAPGAERSLMRLPHKIAAAVVEFITVTLPANPERLSKPLRHDLDGQ